MHRLELFRRLVEFRFAHVFRDIADPAASIRLLRFYKPKTDDNTGHRQEFFILSRAADLPSTSGLLNL